MRPVAADFAPQRAWLSWAHPMVWVAALAFVSWAGTHIASDSAELDALSASSAPPSMAQDAPASGVIRAADDARQLARMASFDLNAGLQQLESTRIAGIRLTGLEANAGDEAIRIEVEAADGRLLLDYLEALNAGMPEGQRWILVRARGATAAAPAAATLLWPSRRQGP